MELIEEIVSTAFFVLALFAIVFTLFAVVHLTFSTKR